ncbi:MAG: NYN domain-containing protein [Actinomycetota bacterium]|nr:NYN domain-containing protein [Actinomycetota bacterium]
MRALLVDGYNAVYAHPDLSGLVESDPYAAREGLIRELSPLASTSGYELVIIVFDAGGSRQAEPVWEDRGGLRVVFTRRSQTADGFIEAAVRRLVKEGDVEVATSDRLLASLASGFGAGSMSCKALFHRTREALEETRREADRLTGSGRTPLEDRLSDEIRRLLDEMRYR